MTRLRAQIESSAQMREPSKTEDVLIFDHSGIRLTFGF